ncbi:MAG TPA: hypothetical protein HA349_03135 [Methanotrichaceae archaeon]|nr:hypothetical protein [Methanotrichaceae archaeon]
MIDPTPRGANRGLGNWFEDFDLERVQQNGITDRQIDPVTHWWLDA